MLLITVGSPVRKLAIFGVEMAPSSVRNDSSLNPKESRSCPDIWYLRVGFRFLSCSGYQLFEKSDLIS